MLANVDLDGFKQVNDNHGHAAGDALLQEIANRPSAHVRGNDTVARLGGDEFVLILEELDDPTAVSPLGEKLCAALSEPCTLQVDGRSIVVTVSASIGIARFRPDTRAEAAERLMRAADNAMYQAKRAGKNRCVLAD